MKKVLVALISISCFSFPTAVLAELNYDAITLGYGKVSASGSPDMTGYVFGITKSLTNNVYFGAAYERDTQPTDTILGDITGNSIALDVGYHTPLKDNTDTDLVFAGSLMNGSYDFAGFSGSQNGYHLSAGIRAALAQQFEVGFGFGYSKVNDSFLGSTSSTTSTGFNASIGYRITPEFELIAEVGSSNHTPQNYPSYSTTSLAFGAKIYY